MYRFLVFPCGSEIGLEIYRSMQYSCHFELIGASSVQDHGRFVYEDYIDGLPFHTQSGFIERLNEIVVEYHIDAIYPAMDAVADTLRQNEEKLMCRIVGSNALTTSICNSKLKTYNHLREAIPIPELYSFDSIPAFPVFLKPIVGYGSRNVFRADNKVSLNNFLSSRSDSDSYLISEYLPGPEYTIDCFTDRHGDLLFSGCRTRDRIANGISVNTNPYDDDPGVFTEFASTINKAMIFRGAWFFQMKRDRSGELKLLEVAARLGGSSALFRNKGVNFALLTAFDSMDQDVSIILNDYKIELDRALDNLYKIQIEYDVVYLDFDDCLCINNRINYKLAAFIYKAIDLGKRIVLLTKHKGVLEVELTKRRMKDLFDEIIHLNKNDNKSDYINNKKAIFIDDSFHERLMVKEKCGIPVFSPDMVESLY